MWNKKHAYCVFLHNWKKHLMAQLKKTLLGRLMACSVDVVPPAFFRWEKREIGSFTALLLLQLLSLATCIQSNSLCSGTFSMSCGEKMLLKVGKCLMANMDGLSWP